ncbi:MAG: hypothetical protein WCL44_14125 [bacterium]
MKIYCQSCDYPNDLGHLFCIKCGAKLVMEHVREDIETDRMVERTKSRLLVLLLAAAAIAIILGVLALWPHKPFRRDATAAGNLDRVEMAISRLQTAAESSRTPFTNEPVSEADLNKWLAAACGRLNAKSMTIRLDPGLCRMRIVFEAGPWKLFKSEKTFGPVAYSREFTCGVTSNGLVVVGAKMGHMPLFGPFLRYSISRTAAKFGDFEKERMILSRVESMTVDDGKITISVMSPP